MVLEEYSPYFAYYGTVFMLPLFVCPLYTCFNVIKLGFSDFFPPDVFLNGLLSSVLFYHQAKLLLYIDMMRHNLFGIVLQLIYLSVQYFYLLNKAPFHRALIKTGIWLSLIFIYLWCESPYLAPIRFKYIITAFNLSALYHPLCSVVHTIKTKSTNGIPHSIIFFGQLVTTIWLLFAISINDLLFTIQMLFSFILGCIQLVLYIIYPSNVFSLKNNNSEFMQRFQNQNTQGLYIPNLQHRLYSTYKKAADRKTRLAKLKNKTENCIY